MKYISVILNVCLLIAVIVLFFLYFSLKKSIVANNNSDVLSLSDTLVASNSNNKSDIVYIHTDSLISNYLYSKNLNKKLETKRKEKEKFIEIKSKKLQDRIDNFKSNMNNLTPTEQQLKANSIYEEEQKLYQLSDNESRAFMEEQQKLTIQLYDSIVSYLKRYNKTKKYKFILGYTEGSGILLPDSKYDITNDIIKGMNEEYLAKNKK